ncbi:MAG: hypothetical protein ACFCUQ_15035 [Kiloniellales bacterium]
MNSAAKMASLDDEYREVEASFWQLLKKDRYDDESYDKGQYQLVFENLIPKVRRCANHDGLSRSNYEARLREAASIVDDIAFALSAGSENKRPGCIWSNPPLDCVTSRPKDWFEASPVDKSQLDAATAAIVYLTQTISIAIAAAGRKIKDLPLARVASQGMA